LEADGGEQTIIVAFAVACAASLLVDPSSDLAVPEYYPANHVLGVPLLAPTFSIALGSIGVVSLALLLHCIWTDTTYFGVGLNGKHLYPSSRSWATDQTMGDYSRAEGTLKLNRGRGK
jgi:hypothetical protein